MFESIISPRTAERDPWDMIAFGFIVCSLAVWMGFYLSRVIPAPGSMLSLAVAVIAMAPLIYRILLIEEEKEELASHNYFWGFITRHTDVIMVYSCLFIGILICFAFWYTVLPAQSDVMPSSSEIFGIQESTIPGVKEQVSGGAVEQNSGVDDAPSPEQRSVYFQRLFDNNMKVMLLCFLSSVLFGAGALWLITWNASVIGVFIGSEIQKNLLHGLATPFGMSLWAIPEVLGFLVASIAGGILAVAVSRHHFKSEKFWLTSFDAGFFLLIAMFLIILGAYIEHFFV